MNGASLIRDLAVVMIVSGVITLIFRRLKQPVVLGYLLAGCVLGPNIPSGLGVENEESVRQFADLGLVFLMFSLGLDFSLRRMKEVGTTVGIAAVFQVGVMVWLGFTTGKLLHWQTPDCILLGMGLAATSTTIVLKSLRDAGELDTPHARLFSGLSIFEDIIVILFMALLPGLAGQQPSAGVVGVTAFKLAIFLVAAIVLGLLAVPRLLNWITKLRSAEMLLITVLSLLFGFALLMLSLEYSVALGAFIMGGLVAESRALGRVRDLTAPLRDMFSAVFFVSIGMLLDPRAIADHWLPVLIVALVYVGGKIAGCTIGLFMTGTPAALSLRVGLNMAQLGEFAFVVAGVGVALGMGSEFLFPIVVTVSVLNAVIRPYLVGRAEFLADALYRATPEPVRVALGSYNRWLAAARHHRKSSAGSRFAVNLLLQLALNATLVAALFLAAGYLENRFPPPGWLGVADGTLGEGVLYWFCAMLACMPLLVASHRKFEALGMLLADMAIPSAMNRAATLRPLLARMLHVAGSVVMGGILVASSTALLPGWPTLLLLLGSAAILGILFGRSFNAWYSRAKFALVDTWQNPPASDPVAPALPPVLKDADLSLHAIGPHLAGLLIRELNLRARTGVSIVAIERTGRSIVNPGPDELLQAGDQLLLLGSPGQLPRAVELLQRPPAG